MRTISLFPFFLLKNMLLTFFLLACISLMAQQYKLDSLWRVGIDPNASDVARCNALYHWVLLQQSKLSQDSIRLISQKIKQLAKQSQDALAMSMAARMESVAYRNELDSLKNIASLSLEAVKLSKQQGVYPNRHTIALIHNAANYYKINLNAYDKAIKLFKEGENLLNSSSIPISDLERYYIYGGLGACYLDVKQYDQAKYYVLKGINAAQKVEQFRFFYYPAFIIIWVRFIMQPNNSK